MRSSETLPANILPHGHLKIYIFKLELETYLNKPNQIVENTGNTKQKLKFLKFSIYYKWVSYKENDDVVKFLELLVMI